MKKALLIIFLTACLGGSAQAGLAMFDFDGLLPGTDAAGIGTYMTGLYGSAVTVTGATSYPYLSGTTLVNPLSALSSSGTDADKLADQYIADAEGGHHEFYISFSVPIVSLSFDWARESDPFKVEATYAGGIRQVFSVGTGAPNGGTGNGTETIDLLALLGSPVTRLYFHDGGKGGIGIDNLTVTSVAPLPASILLGVFAVGLAGRKLRQFL